VDAQVQVSGLAAGQVTTINVQVSGTQAVLAPAPAATPSPSPPPFPHPPPRPTRRRPRDRRPLLRLHPATRTTSSCVAPSSP
jgi:hypothetical protein